MEKRTRANSEGSIYQLRDRNGKLIDRYAGALTTKCLPPSPEHPKGKQIRKIYRGDTKTEVRNLLDDARQKLKQGVDLSEDKMTVGEWLDTWLITVKATLRTRTYDSYKYLVDQHIRGDLKEHRVKSGFAEKKLSKLTVGDVQRWLNSLGEEPSKRPRLDAAGERVESKLSASTIQRARAVLRSALTTAEEQGLVMRNVAKFAKVPKGTKKEVEALTLEQVVTLLATIKNDPNEALIAVTLGCGLRQGEVLALRWKDIDLESATLRVREQLQRIKSEGAKSKLVLTEPKTTKSKRVIPIPIFAIEALSAHQLLQEGSMSQREKRGLEPEDLVFTNTRGRAIEPRRCLAIFQDLLATAGLAKTRFHDLRHSTASLLIAGGADIKSVQATLGHAQVATTLDIYAHLVTDAQRRSMANLDAAILREKEKKSENKSA